MSTYKYQQALLNCVANELGVVAFRPNYHGKKGDKNTVLFYTKADDAYNHKVDNLPFAHNEDFKTPFFCFSNTDINGFLDYDFCNFGKLRLNDRDGDARLKEAIASALEKRISEEGFPEKL